MMSKRRGKHVSDKEKHVLLQLIQPHLSVIENIKTDGATNKMKCSVWESIVTSYNALQTTGPRTSSQLKALFDVMKRKTKKDKSSEKVNSYIHQTAVQTEREKDLMLDLISENKLSLDSFASSDIQSNAWNTIAEGYNQLQTSGAKTIDELKTMNQLLYKSAKSDLNNEKRDIYKTGGGQSQIHSSTISSKIIGMMGNRFESVESPYDCDGDFPSTSAVINKSYSPVYTDDQCVEIFDDSSPVEYSYLGTNDINTTVMEVSCLEPSLKFDDVVDDQHTVYENMTCHKESIQKPSETSTPQEKLSKISTMRVPPKKVYENLKELANKQLSSCNLKESFKNDYNNLKRKQSDIKLEILEIERTVAIKKLKGERDNYTSQAKQNKLKEDILEHELKKKLKEL